MSWFGAPLGLLALLAVPAVIALHLYRRRHRELAVSALFLWEDPEAVDDAGPVRQPLRATPSFWLELLAALLAALLLADFDPLRGSDAVHLVAVLDDSASMGAVGAGGTSARDRAIEALDRAFARHGRRTRVTLVRSGRRPTLLCGPGALVPEAQHALASWQPRAPSHDPWPALALARELAGEGELLLLTDALPDESALDAGTRVLALGEPLDNLALLDARRVPADDGEHDRVECLLRSFAATLRSTTLRVTAGGAPVLERALTLDPGAATTLAFDVPASTPALTLRLDGDALAVDDGAVLHPPPRRRVRVGLALDEGLAELLGLPALERVLPDVELTAGDADLIIAHAPVAPPAWSLVLPHDAGELEAYVGPFLADSGHPLLEGLTLEGLVWTRSLAFRAAGVPLISAGDVPLLTEAAADGATTLELDLVPSRSTLQRSPDWPILLANLVAARREALPGPREVNLVAGEAFVCMAEQERDWLLGGPGGETALPRTDRLVLDDLPVHGDYQLRGDDGPTMRFAVNFADGAESDLSGRATGDLGPRSAGVSLGRQRLDESLAGLVLLLMLGAAVVADWLVLGRRAPA